MAAIDTPVSVSVGTPVDPEMGAALLRQKGLRSLNPAEEMLRLLLV